MMKNEMTVARLAAALKKVPEKKFRIYDLAPHLVDEKGRVDVVRCLDRQAEINMAVLEVDNYVKAAREMRAKFSYIGGESVGGDNEFVRGIIEDMEETAEEDGE